MILIYDNWQTYYIDAALIYEPFPVVSITGG